MSRIDQNQVDMIQAERMHDGKTARFEKKSSVGSTELFVGMENIGFEPVTSCVQSRRSPN